MSLLRLSRSLNTIISCCHISVHWSARLEPLSLLALQPSHFISTFCYYTAEEQVPTLNTFNQACLKQIPKKRRRSQLKNVSCELHHNSNYLLIFVSLAFWSITTQLSEMIFNIFWRILMGRNPQPWWRLLTMTVLKCVIILKIITQHTLSQCEECFVSLQSFFLKFPLHETIF